MSKITIEDVRNLPQVRAYIEKGNDYLGIKGYTDHGFRHAGIVSTLAGKILRELDYPERTCELAEIAGYLHDIGNFVSRTEHGQTGAVIALRILEQLGMDFEEVAIVASAIGNHEEQNGAVLSDVAAAIILADKSDVHRSRVRNVDRASFDIHDRVNYAAQQSSLTVTRDEEGTHTVLDITIDREISQVMEYFEIFLTRMMMCRRAADFLDSNFNLIINEYRLL